MEIIKLLKKYAKIRLYAGMIAVGLVFVLISGLSLMQPEKDLITADAEITSIRELGYDSDGSMQYEVLVRFTDEENRVHRDVEYTAYSSSMKVGDTVQVEYEKGHPESVNPAGLGWMPYAFGVLGVVLAAGGVICLKKFRNGDYEKEISQLDRVDLSAVDPEVIEAIENSSEPVRTYYFHFTGKMNQSYVMETPEREPVYLADCKAFPLLKPYVFDFVDCRTGGSKTSEVTHTVTKSAGAGNGASRISIVTSSRFSIDGVDCWDFLAEMGCSLKPEWNGIRLNYDVFRYGVKVARLNAAGANILRDDKQYKLDIPGDGIYVAECRASDIEMVFMSAFVVSRAESSLS